MEAEQARVSQFQSELAKARRLAETATVDLEEPIGTNRAIMAEQETSTAERLHAEQTRAALSQQSIGLSPAVNYLAASGGIDSAIYRQATAQADTLAQQMRAAKSMVELQLLNRQYQALNRGLTESGLTELQTKAINEGRRWLWRTIVDGAPLVDDFLFGADFGVGTTIGASIDGYQWLSGMANIEERIESRGKLLLPPPRTMQPPKDTGFVTHMMHWWDVLASALIWVVQIGMVLVLGLSNFIMMGVGSYCAIDVAFSLNESICIEMAGGLVNIIRAAITGG